MEPLYNQKTYYPTKDKLKNEWIVIDSADQVLGRIASKAANRLMGKHLPIFQPGATVGDSVIIINASKIKVTGAKLDQKNYYNFSGYRGGLRTVKMRTLYENTPEKIVLIAIKGMLPKNKYGRKLLRRVRVFAGAEHNMTAQKAAEVSASIK
ncbi:MAG: 50S ribosomal protein L13 [Spirochaetia bacterium]|nr:50S ribosomal protein L13 [Spirochaetia bacterium]